MHTRIAGLLTLSTLFVLSGCASMSADECAMSDWHTIGYEDGSMGYTAARIGEHRKACAKHGVAPDFNAYQAGHSEGVRQYCQPSRAFNVAASGGRYNGICPSDLEPDFVDAFNSGHRLYQLRSNVNSANYEINAKRAELERTENQIRQAEADLIDPETPTEDRILLLVDLKDFAERKGTLEAEIVELIEERAGYERDLAAYEAYIADSGF